LIEACDPASLLVVVDRRMGTALRRRYSPDDVLQDALLVAWRAWPTLVWQGVPAFRRWILTVIDHRLCDLADRESAGRRGGTIRHEPLHPADEATDRSPPGLGWPTRSTTPSRIAMHRERAAAIGAALDALPADDAHVLRLRLLEQVPLQTIAEELGVTIDSVRHRFRRGAERFQAILANRLTDRRS
jgi:RNA polymerase sigma-70 factor (ECF subfamily)